MKNRPSLLPYSFSTQLTGRYCRRLTGAQPNADYGNLVREPSARRLGQSLIMKFLLDTNIWSYVADFDSQSELLRLTRKGRTEFLIAPGSVTEARSLREPSVRKKLLSVMTNRSWKRLMPDTFLEAEELKVALLSTRPQWKNTKATDNAYVRARFYFRRSRGGFWDIARDESPLPVTDESLREARENELARQQVKEIRDHFKVENQRGAETNLQKVFLDLEIPILGRHHVEYWRRVTAYHFEEEMKVFASPYREFLDCFIDIEKMFSDMQDFKRVWYEEIEPSQLKRQWLRATMEYLQRWHKPTSGSPADSLLAVHMLDADYFVTADKNFAKCLEKIHQEAPFKTAMPLRVSGGEAGVSEMLKFSGQE